VLLSVEQTENMGAQMVPLYAARIEDLGPGDIVKVGRAHLLQASYAILDRRV
jgi:hypothetical protein